MHLSFETSQSSQPVLALIAYRSFATARLSLIYKVEWQKDRPGSQKSIQVPKVYQGTQITQGLGSRLHYS